MNMKAELKRSAVRIAAATMLAVIAAITLNVMQGCSSFRNETPANDMPTDGAWYVWDHPTHRDDPIVVQVLHFQWPDSNGVRDDMVEVRWIQQMPSGKQYTVKRLLHRSRWNELTPYNPE